LYTSQYAAASDPANAIGDFGINVDTLSSLTPMTDYEGLSINVGAAANGGFNTAGSPVGAIPNGVFSGIGSSGVPNRQSLFSSVFPNSNYTAGNTSPQRVDITFAKDSQSQEDWELERAALLPSDVRIEAVLYAEDNSFFVIPGPWFNSDGGDTIDKFINSNAANLAADPSRNHPYIGTNNTSGAIDPSFPFYGQPIDMKITIDGSVIENVTADISDQQAWMTKWGWIPRFQGNPNAVTINGTAYGPFISPHSQQFSANGMTLPPVAVDLALPTIAPNSLNNSTDLANFKKLPGVGLNIIYDNMLGSASIGKGTTFVDHYVRLDQYGRPLPAIPNLPVSSDLLYSGQASDNSLVQ
jgi:hypothetical protein